MQLEAQIIAIVAATLSEVHDGAGPVQVTLGSHLERDLGIFSLERVELFMRLEETCGIRLPEDAIAGVELVGDVVAVMAGQPFAFAGPAAHPQDPEASDHHHAGCRSVVFTAYLALHLTLIAVPVWVIAGLVGGGRWGAGLMRRAARCLVRLSPLPVNVTGLANLTNAAPAVLVANHQSYVDSVILLATLPLDLNVAVNEKLVRAPVIGRLVAAAGYLVADRTSTRSRLQCAARMTEVVRNGDSLLLFPDGTFPVAPRLLPFRLGAFAAAVEAERPVVPVVVEGSRELLPWGTWLLRRTPIRVTVHPPFHPSGNGWREAVRLRSRLTRRRGSSASRCRRRSVRPPSRSSSKTKDLPSRHRARTSWSATGCKSV